MKREIVFVNNEGTPDPIGRSKEAGFRDIICKEEYRDVNIKFRTGLTWLRFLPRVKGSLYDWMMPLDVHQDVGGTSFASPKTFDQNAPSVFEAARLWFRRNHPETLSNKDTNPNGFKLWAKRVGVSWVIEEQAPEGERLRLLIRSLYDGGRGGSTGLSYNIRREADSRDNEPGSPTAGALIHGDITAPEEGRLVKVERLVAEKNEFANYKIGIGKNPAPIGHFMAQLTEKENNLIVPLENTIYLPDEEEQKEILRRYIGDRYFGEMFGAPKTEGWTPQSDDAPEAKAAEKAPEPTPVVEPTPVAKTEAEPASQPAPKADTAEPVTPAAAEEPKQPTTPPATEEVKPYTTKDVTTLLAREKEGVIELLANRTRLTKPLLDIVLDSAKEYGIEA